METNDIRTTQLPVVLIRTLIENGIATVQALSLCSRSQLLGMNNIGNVFLGHIKECLSRYNLTLRDEHQTVLDKAFEVYVNFEDMPVYVMTRCVELGARASRALMRDNHGEERLLSDIVKMGEEGLGEVLSGLGNTNPKFGIQKLLKMIDTFIETVQLQSLVQK